MTIRINRSAPRLWLGGLAIAGAALVAALWPPPAWASPTEVVKAVFSRSGDSWHVSVTLRHADTGWKHYADVWIVETTGGKELGRRVLVHPHVNEQPFTRSDIVTIPAGITKVQVRAGDKPNGMDSNTVVVDLSTKSGERFEVR